ncbi:MAG: NADH-quinone oxidoreductase subunit C [Candidatus Omnitrophica bacterium]|nr:NADH-quinone oxidoreductase subunit C [Candidatus Omnitrophota bacterium]
MFSIVAPSLDSVQKALANLYDIAIDQAVEFRGELTLYVKPDRIVEVCKALRDHADLVFDMISDLTAVDHLQEMKEGEPRFHVVYHLFSTKMKHRIRLKAPVWEQSPEIDTVMSVWCGANWHERECFDMFGILFRGHPDLRRILMPEDWEGHPLRKDYPVSGQEVYEYINKQLADE